MPRIKRDPELAIRIRHPQLVARLAEELREARESGQPLIDEQQLPRSDAFRINVVWDEWEAVQFDERVAIIHEAYRQAEGRIPGGPSSLVMGLTFPEAYENGMLPFQVVPILRKDDPVNREQCERAMVAEGASLLFVPDHPRLRFAAREDADACVARLVNRLPDSEQVWAVTEEIGQMQARVFD